MANEQKNLPALQTSEIAKKLNEQVNSVMSNTTLLGFERAFQIASAVSDLKTLLTPEYMKPIMALQGNKLGFKTDKDDKGGYSEDIVKNCLIEAVLTGVTPYGNSFNIISGSMYVTKEGFGYLLSNFKGLSYEIIAELPRIKEDKSGAAVVMNVVWTLNGEKKERKLDLPIKMNAYMGADAVLGKATRKARAWLYNTITGSEIGDGDVQDTDYKVQSSKIAQPEPKTAEDIEMGRILKLIQESASLDEISKHEKHLKKYPDLKEAYDNHFATLKALNS